MRLSQRDFDRLQDAIWQLYVFRDLEAFRAAVPGIILRLIPADAFVWPQFQLNRSARQVGLADAVSSHAGLPAFMFSRDASTLFQHPFEEHFATTPDQQPLKISDFWTLRQFRNTALFDHVYRPQGFRHELGCTVTPRPGLTTAALTIERNRPDFSDRDRLLLDLLRPHFNQAHRNAQLVSAWMARRVIKPLATYHLSPRESEVASWLAQGKTNAEIAIILQAQPRTIEKHVEKILEKLCVENRTAAAVTLAAANGIEQTGTFRNERNE